MRRFVACLLATGVVAAVLAAVPNGGAGAQAAPRRVLLRDAEAGRWRFGATRPDVQPDTTVEPSIAVNPADPLHAVAGYQEGRIDRAGAAMNGFATTFDGGRTWTFGEPPKLTTFNGGTYERTSDPVVAFGPNGVVYYSSLVLTVKSEADFDAAVVNHTSHDGGRTWEDPTVVAMDDDTNVGSVDKNWVVVDHGDGPGHHKGRVYVVWFRLAPFATYSDDEGKTWAPITAIASPVGFGAVPLVMPNGDLAVVFTTSVSVAPVVHPEPGENLNEPADETARVAIALAPGAGSVPTGAPLTFTPPVTIGTVQDGPVRLQRTFPGLPTAGVDARTGRIYVAWSDKRHRTDGMNDIVVTQSDNGVTWPAPVRVNGGPTGDYVNRWNAALAVGEDGAVHMAYRQRQEGADEADISPYVDTYYQESVNGLAWSAAARVNTVRTDTRFAAFSRGGAFLGDYQQVAVSGPLVYVVRCEAYQLEPDEPATFPPQVHHQRTWVAVLGPAGSAVDGAAGGGPTPVSQGGSRPPGSGALPATGAPSRVAAVALLLAAFLALRARAWTSSTR